MTAKNHLPAKICQTENIAKYIAKYLWPNNMNFDKTIIADNFSKNADRYNRQANIQKLCAKKLCDFIIDNIALNDDLKNLKTLEILDLGSGSSFIAKNLFERQLPCRIYELDLSLKMLQNFYSPNLLHNTNHHFKICGDIEKLPFAPHSFNLITASFSLQWLKNYRQIFNQLKKLLTHHGKLAIVIPDSRSFKQLRDNPFKLAPLPESTELDRALIDTGFVAQFYYHETIQEQFNNPLEALQTFKKIGTNYRFVIDDHNNSDNLNGHFSKMRKFYLKNFQNKLDFQLDWSISYYIYSLNYA